MVLPAVAAVMLNTVVTSGTRMAINNDKKTVQLINKTPPKSTNKYLYDDILFYLT